MLISVTGAWLAELARVALGALAALALGWLIGFPGMAVLAALLGYLGWNLHQVWRLHHWLKQGKNFEPPQARGLWGDIFDAIFRLQQRNRKRKRRLSALLRRFHQLAAAVPDAIVVIDADWQIEWVNDAANTILGLLPHDVGQRIDNLVRHPDFGAHLARDDFSHALEIPSPEDERRILSLDIVPYGKQQRLLIARDITHLRKLEEMRRDFIANVSHELRTPLTVMVGFLETLRDDDDACARQWARELELMQQQAMRMQRLVEDIMLLSRLETRATHARQDDVAVPALLDAIHQEATLLSGTAAHRIRLDVDAQLWLRGNTEELRSAFSNLIFNAVKYTPPGGEIVVRWARDADGAPRLAVQDAGIGIEARHIPRLTERFYRIDVARSRDTGGTGLGLAIVKHVLNRHGARLEIASTPGTGSTFSCHFPATSALAATAVVS